MEELTERLIKFFGEEWLLYALDPTISAVIIKICCILAISIIFLLCCIIIYCISRWIVQAPWQRHENLPIQRNTESFNQRGESRRFDGLFRITKDIVAIDCEMVTCFTTEEWRKTAINPETLIQPIAARYAIVDYDLKVICQGYINPPLEVEKWKGLEDNKTNVQQGENFYEARAKILGVLRGKRVVAHHYQHDFNSLNIDDDDFPEEDIRDTSTCKLLREKAELTHLNSTHTHIKLKDLVNNIFEVDIPFQPNRQAHDPVEDAKMAMRLYKCVEYEWEWEKRIQQRKQY